MKVADTLSTPGRTPSGCQSSHAELAAEQASPWFAGRKRSVQGIKHGQKEQTQLRSMSTGHQARSEGADPICDVQHGQKELTRSAIAEHGSSRPALKERPQSVMNGQGVLEEEGQGPANLAFFRLQS